MPKDNKRRTFIKTIGLGTSGLLAGCTGTQNNTPSPTLGGGGNENSSTSKYRDLKGREVHWITGESSEDIQQVNNKLKNDFEEKTNGKLIIEYTGLAETEKRVSQLIQAGDPPEITVTSTTQATQYLTNNIAAQTNEAIEWIADEYGDFPDGTMLARGDNVFNVPVFANVAMNWYRGDIYDERPDTWESALAQAEEHDNPDGTRGHFVPAGNNFVVHLFVTSFAYSNNARIAARRDGNIQSIMNEGENRNRWIETLEYLKELHNYSSQNASASSPAMTKAIANKSAADVVYFGTRPKYQCIQQDTPYAKDVHATLIPEKRSQTTTGVMESFVTFNGSNVRAANTFMKFFYGEGYIYDYLLTVPIHNAPVLEGLKESDRYQQAINDLPSAWNEEDIQTALEAPDHFLPIAFETNPPNPYAGAIGGSTKIAEMTQKVLIEDEDAETMLDQYSKEVQSVIDNSRE